MRPVNDIGYNAGDPSSNKKDRVHNLTVKVGLAVSIRIIIARLAIQLFRYQPAVYPAQSETISLTKKPFPLYGKLRDTVGLRIRRRKVSYFGWYFRSGYHDS